MIKPFRKTSQINWPVLTQEMRVRQRGIKPFIVVFIYAAVMSAVAILVLQSVAVAFARPGGFYPGNARSMQGRTLFAALSMVQLAMIVLIVPAYSAGAVTVERERGTFDLVALTLLSSSSVVMQKLAAALAQALMLAIASVPVVSIVFMLGGVSPLEIALAYLLLVLVAAALGALGMLCSCQFASTKVATLVAYAAALAFVVGMPLLGQLLRSMRYSDAGATSFSLSFAGMYAFVCGLIALVLYGVAALIARKRTLHWRSRTFRMAVFGGIYALTLLVLSVPATLDRLINSLFGFGNGMFLPLYLNPFVAMETLLFHDQMTYSGSSVQAYVPVIATMAFAVGCVYLFKQLSAYRFEAMRRS